MLEFDILIKILSYHFVKLNNFMRCYQNFMIFYTVLFVLHTNALNVER